MAHHHKIEQRMEDCIQRCLECARTCTEHFARHCLEAGGKHVEAAHARLMLNCAEVCQLAANFMLRGAEQHRMSCGLCAQVCRACAESCDAVGDMDSCVEACRRCAESCGAMAG